MHKLIILLQIANNEDVGLKSAAIAIIVVLGGVVAYLYKSKESALQKKDEQILGVIKDHQMDLKDSNKDMQVFVEKYHQFMQQITDLVNGRKQL